MSDDSEAYVGIDTSKLRNAVAMEGGRGGDVRFLGEIESSATATAKLVRKLAASRRLTFCYEAGPTVRLVSTDLTRQVQARAFLIQEAGIVRPIDASGGSAKLCAPAS